MRIIPAAAALLAAFTVASCDINTGAQKEAKAPCNCTVPPAAPAAPAAPATREASYHRHHGHHAWRTAAGGGHAYAWRREYAELSVVTYDYRSDSHSYYQGARDGDRGGYRRDHDDRRSAHDDRADAPAHDDASGRARLAPWHGYDSDCPDEERRR